MKKIAMFIFISGTLQLGIISSSYADRAGMCSQELSKPTCEGTYQPDTKWVKGKGAVTRNHSCYWKDGACHKK